MFLTCCKQTVDYRYSEKHARRSSFALVRWSLVSCSASVTWVCSQSDIFELDEEEIQVEFEISPILPATPTSACSSATSRSRSVKSRVKTIFVVSPRQFLFSASLTPCQGSRSVVEDQAESLSSTKDLYGRRRVQNHHQHHQAPRVSVTEPSLPIRENIPQHQHIVLYSPLPSQSCTLLSLEPVVSNA